MPSSLQSLDILSTMQGISAVVNSEKSSSLPVSPKQLSYSSAFQLGRQFGRRPTPIYSQVGKSSPASPTPSAGKVYSEELKILDQLTEELRQCQVDVLDSAFEFLSEESKCQKLDDATAFINNGLSCIAHFEAKSKARAKMNAYRGSEIGSHTPDVMMEKRDSLTQGLKVFHAQICALYAPLLGSRPLVIDTGIFDYHTLTFHD